MILDALTWLLSCLPGAIDVLGGAAWDELRRALREAAAELERAFTYGVLQ